MPNRARIIRYALATAAAASLAVVPAVEAFAANSTPPAATHPGAAFGIGIGSGPAAGSETKTEAANKALILSFDNQLFNLDDYSVIDQYVAPGYLQHNPTLGDGPVALKALVVGLHAAFPNFHSTAVRALAEGDLVLLQSDVVTVPGTAGQAVFDVYRVDGGKIVEHWDTLQAIPAGTASGNDMFAQLTKPTSDTATAACTAADRALVLNYFTELTQNHDPNAITADVAPNLVQHDPTLADGAGALKQAYSTLFAQNPAYNTSVVQVVADGDLVAVHAHVQNVPSDLGTSEFYLFRVVNGKIVEEWDALQAVPTTSQNANTMF